ncbi:hypothetical protein CVT26_012625 [Gymnopilus dilepis]|uniref:Uncharacterized protein n=1 Tax=Gymnopilus dilepis TaxID=231916 RepID=A0A409YQ06_9AGAR|nr:hypothetical protein CVT26_012625 [Gymnopilus dilepis]
MDEVTTHQSNQAGSTELSNPRRRLSSQKYYQSKRDELRLKARERAARAKLRRMESETPEEAEERRSRHREAAARYREANRNKIRLKALERRYAQYSQYREANRNKIRLKALERRYAQYSQ